VRTFGLKKAGKSITMNFLMIAKIKRMRQTLSPVLELIIRIIVYGKKLRLHSKEKLCN
jgi:hypothetical protein